MPDAVPAKKTCFVVMGFGEKTDYQSQPQRVLNLDRSFRNIIKPAIEEAGLQCIRADEIIHSTVIDKPMYEQLLNADVVVADLSTSNANAIYELGVRHALRPYTTIVMAEKNFRFPFDLGHVSILTYEHLGPDIGFSEAVDVKNRLKDKIVHLVNRLETDSPVYVFLPDLASAVNASAAAVPAPPSALEAVPAPPAARSDVSFGELMDSFLAAKQASDFGEARAYLKQLRKMQPADSFITRELALATYKAGRPDKISALHEARKILEPLTPGLSSNGETVALWGAVHKRIWEEEKKRPDLDEALAAYERGFYLRTDYYNGINYAFLLDLRALLTEGDDRICDRVLARRVRARVLALCDERLADRVVAENAEERFWVRATKIEALFGLGRTEEGDALRRIAVAEAPAAWMVESMNDQLDKLKALLAA